MGQVHGVDGLGHLHQGVHVVAAFQDGLLDLLVVLGQGLALVDDFFVAVTEIFSPQDKVMQLAVDRIAIQRGQTAAVDGIFVFALELQYQRRVRF